MLTRLRMYILSLQKIADDLLNSSLDIQQGLISSRKNYNSNSYRTKFQHWLSVSPLMTSLNGPKQDDNMEIGSR